MKMLRLAHSQEMFARVPPEKRVQAVAGRRFEEVVGEPVETVHRMIWPNPELPQIIGSWMERYQPDLVYLSCTGFWYTWDSSLVKLRRRFRLAASATRAIGRLSFSDSVAHNRAYRALRRLGLRTIGGAPFFQPEEIADLMEASLRSILAHEPAGVIFRLGPALAHHSTAANRAECIRRRAVVHGRLKPFCERLHIIYQGSEDDRMYGEEPEFFFVDHLHWNEAGHARQAELDTEAMLEAWRRAAEVAAGR